VKGGELVVKTFKENHVRLFYGIPAVHNLPIYDATYEDVELRKVMVKHEQAAGFMAIGSNYASGELAVCIVGCGPGATNLLTPSGEAYLDSIPFITLAGGVATSRRGKGALHDIDQVSAFKPITKWADSVSHAGELADKVKRAISLCRSGRPRPVFLEIPFDILAGETPSPPQYKATQEQNSEPLDQELMKKTISKLLSAQHPIIIAGGGINSSESWIELAELTERLNSPVATTIAAKGAYPEDRPLSLGSLWDEVAQKAVSESDLVLALGCRFSERSTAGWSIKIPAGLIHVDIDPAVFGVNFPPQIAINSDLKTFLTKILAELPDQKNTDRKRWLEELQRIRREKDQAYESYALPSHPLRAPHVVYRLRELLPSDAIIVAETGYAFWWASRLFKTVRPRSFLTPSGNSSLGFAFPAALGGKYARPDRPVVCLVGDGGFLLTCQEIATAIENEIPVLTVILDDRGYAAIREYQIKGFGGRVVGSNFPRRTDFARLAESFGASGITVEKSEELDGAIKEGLNSSKPTIVDVIISRQDEVLPGFLLQSYKSSKE
jgi:acetolactate synthase-1/2/3 large subunit